jgi:hypothetical protein
VPDPVRHGGSSSLGGVVLALVVGTVCVQAIADVLPHVYVPLAVLGLVFALVRLVLFHTRKW